MLDRSKGRRLDKFGIQRIILKVFLKKFGDDYELESPIGRHILHGDQSRILPVGTNKKNVYDTYIYGWQFLLSTTVLPRRGTIETLGPLSYATFRRYWREDSYSLLLATGGSDFCD